jgi:hypothetical protein
MNQSTKSILVGDNPFHGVSHISRERELQRTDNIGNVGFAAELVMTSIRNGATGFTFTVSDITLAILEKIGNEKTENIGYYPLVPNVAELVRMAGSTGGIPRLAIDMARRVVRSRRVRVPLNLGKGIILNDPGALFKSYIAYEHLRLEHVVGKGTGGSLRSILLHEIVTDMALALDMEWLFRAHIVAMNELGLKPGFETRNLPYLVKQFKKWQIDPAGMVIEAPFNVAGFQMCPSRKDCESSLEYLQTAKVIAFSILAAGYLKLSEALDYITNLKGLCGIAVGVSSKKQAVSTFSLARRSFT